jgi:PAS domain S-box-containing protein
VTAQLEIARIRREASDALQQSHARFEALFDAAPIGIYLVDANMRIRQVNPKALPVFGDIEGLIGGDFVKIIHLLWPQRYADELVERFRHTLETGVPYFTPERIEERLDRKVIEYYEWQLQRISLPDGQYGVVCYFSDISRHVLAQRALVEADRLKDEFLATLAHELRNPLAPLRNGLQIMKLASSAAAKEKARAMMERQLNQMVRLVDDLFDVSRISRGKVELKKERVELAKVVQQAVENCRLLIDQASHELLVNVPPDPIYMEADIIRLTQVFTNLLNNAVKYTERGGRIWLTVQREGSDAVVMVKDNGVGISIDMLPRIFELFTQVDGSLAKSQGDWGSDCRW